MSESLKIAFYTDSFLPAVDGVVVSILNFREELEKRGHEVYIYASGNEKTKQMMHNDKRVVVVRGVKFSKYPQYNLALFPFGSRLKNISVRMDINHAQTPFMMGVNAFVLSKIEKIPIVGSFHTMITDKAVIRDYATRNEFLAKRFIKYGWKYARLFYNRCDGVIAPSNTVKGILERNGIHNVSVIPNGIDLKKFSPKVDGSAVRKTLAKKDEKLVMYVGRISSEKHLETLIKAAHVLKKEDIKFALVGAGPALERYQQLASNLELNDKLKFVGFVDNKELPKYYAACDAFCIPSTFETQGVVSLEALSTGKPVIGADYLALKELIKNGKNGEKFRPNDSKDCARKIRKVIYNIGTYKEMVSTAKRFSIENTTDDLLKLYRTILNRQ